MAIYIVSYQNLDVSSQNEDSSGMLNVSWTENNVVLLSNLQPDAQYTITVSTLTSAGQSGE